MKKFFILSLLLLQACSSTVALRCYEIVGDPDGTRLILDENASQPMLTITDPVGGEDLEVLGGLREGVFVYPDGSELNYNDEKAWFDADEPLVGGIEATAVTCK